MSKTNFAKAIRVVSAPPIMISSLIIILYSFKPEYFKSFLEALIMIFLLGIVPSLAYPAHKFVPKFQKQGRKGQRALAFIMSLVGYASALAWAIISRASLELLLICIIYFLSVVFLTLCNKLHFKASGHACSFSGPLVILVYEFGWKMLLPCLAVAFAISWSSVYLKRHTIKQIFGGIFVCFLSFVIALFLIKL